MAYHTQLGDSDLAIVAAAFDLGAVRDWRVIAGGCVNSNFGISTAAGRFFLRINEGKGEADVRYESELVEALAAAGVPTPAPLRTHDGRAFAEYAGKLVSVFPWIDGVHRELAQVSVADAAAVGRALALLHEAGAPLAARFRRESRYRFDEIVARFATFDSRADPELAPAIRAIAEEISWLEAQRDVRERATHGLIHGDLFADNVFFRGDELVALIDFEQASSGSLAYDLAVCIDAWCFREDFAPALVRALVAGYREVRPLTAADCEALYPETRTAATRFTVTRVTDVYLGQAKIPGKDFRRFLQRLERLREIGPERFGEWAALYPL